MNEFQRYLDLGWKLCKIEPGTKGPRTPGWNARENALKDLDGVLGAGLLHAYSGTCAIDIDDWDKADAFFQEHGIDLTMLVIDPNAVTISSGTQGRGKLLYKLQTPLPTIKLADNKLEFRCATKEGTSVQDVLAPSIHPSGRKYQMVGDPAQLPTIPPALLRIWQGNLAGEAPVKPSTPRTGETSIDELETLLKAQDPNMGYDDWYKIGAILHYETGGSDEGMLLWDRWSAPSEKYRGISDIRSHWESFGNSARPLTADGLRHQQIADSSEFEAITPEKIADFMNTAEENNPFIGQFLERHEWGALPKPAWIIEKKFPEVGVGSVWGPSGTGKSFLLLDLAITTALGGYWQSMPVKQGTVLYIAAEDDFGIRERLAAALDARGMERAPVKVLGVNVKLNQAKQMKQIIAAAKKYGDIRMVIVDTLAAATPGMDENMTKEVTAFLALGRLLSHDLQTLVMLVHHTGKDVSRGARGSGAFHGAFDTEWEVESEGLLHTLKQHKIRNGPRYKRDGSMFTYNFTLSLTQETCFVEWIP